VFRDQVGNAAEDWVAAGGSSPPRTRWTWRLGASAIGSSAHQIALVRSAPVLVLVSFSARLRPDCRLVFNVIELRRHRARTVIIANQVTKRRTRSTW